MNVNIAIRLSCDSFLDYWIVIYLIQPKACLDEEEKT